MPKFGAHAFIWDSAWTPQSIERVIRGAREAGLDFVELPLLRPAEVDVAATRELLDSYGMACTVSLGLPPEAHLPAHPEEAEAFLHNAVDVAAELGSPILTGCPYCNLGMLTGEPPTREELATVAAVLKRVAQHLANHAMELGIEPVNRYETYLLNTGEQAADLLQAIGEPNVFVHLDTYHMNIEEKGFREPIERLGPQVKYIHLSESDRGIPGTANVHWDDVFAGLRGANFDGWLAMESFAAVSKDLAGATAMWRDVVGDPDRLVREGLQFLRHKAQEHGVFATER